MIFIRHPWLDGIRHFVSFIRNVDQSFKEHDCPPRPVKVAIIDDGVDKLSGGPFEDMLGISFDTNDDVDNQWFFSSAGHGTLMAKLVRTVCPLTQLHIVRLNETRNEKATQPTVESATQVSSPAYSLVKNCLRSIFL